MLRELTLAVSPGEAVCLLGPSGSGKTTLLYTVAGFLEPASGEVWLSGSRVAWPGDGVAAEHREIGMVFQDYALWPHLTALETVAYPLRRRGVARADAERRARQLLGRVDIEHLAGRRPHELSGGQQQRVGLARALAREPRLFLFDEPTAHLDIPLRAALQDELAERRAEAGAAGLYATHDAAEALAVADRVALMRDGQLVQVAAPEVIYERPMDAWAAQLTGSVSALPCRLERRCANGIELTLVDHALSTDGGAADDLDVGPALALVRPDWTHLDGPLPGTVARVSYRGPHTDYRLETPAGAVTVRASGTPRVAAGGSVTWGLLRAWLVPGVPGQRHSAAHHAEQEDE